MPGFDEPERAPRLLSAVTIVLTAAAGALNVVTYFAFSQVFASTMSGNLILLGLRAGRGEFELALDNALAIAGYCGGLVLGTAFCGLMMRRLPWRNAVGAALTVELVILGLTGLLLFTVERGSPIAQLALFGLVLGSGLAMGVQSAACRLIGPSGTPTSFLSGTVTDWVSDRAEVNGKRPFSWNPPLRIGVLIVVAAISAYVQQIRPGLALALPVLLVAVSVVLMLRVVQANHRGPFHGTPQFATTSA